MTTVGVLTSILAIFQLAQDNHCFICAINDRIYGGEKDRAKPPTAVEGNRTWAARYKLDHRKSILARGYYVTNNGVRNGLDTNPTPYTA